VTDDGIRLLAGSGVKKAHSLEEALGGVEWDCWADFGVFVGQDTPSAAAQNTDTKSFDQTQTLPVVASSSNDSLQERNERVRDSKLRQWYTDTQSSITSTGTYCTNPTEFPTQHPCPARKDQRFPGNTRCLQSQRRRRWTQCGSQKTEKKTV
jgi:hypothetical protein